MTRSQRLPRGLLTLLLPLGLGSGPLFAQDDDPFDRTPADCVSTKRIDRTHAVDDQTILFYMRGDRVYRNYLPRKCPGLELADRFMYETHSTQLCDVDTITVLEQWGARLEPGFTCRLGDFHPLSPEEIEDFETLDEKRADLPGRDAIEVSPVDLPDDDSAADADAEPAAPDQPTDE